MITLKINNILNYINSLYLKCCNLDDTDFVKIEKEKEYMYYQNNKSIVINIYLL